MDITFIYSFNHREDFLHAYICFSFRQIYMCVVHFNIILFYFDLRCIRIEVPLHIKDYLRLFKIKRL